MSDSVMKCLARLSLAQLCLAIFATVLIAGWPSFPARAVSVYEEAIPPSVKGPFLSDPDVMTALDCAASECPGRLSFATLMQARAPASGRSVATSGNPFNLKVARQVIATVKADLNDVRMKARASDGQLQPNFLTDEGSDVELVGIVNRMDRQFVKDPTALTPAQLQCGELSLIYRFSYSIRGGNQQSRLPVTMNLVFPALPSNDKGGTLTCKTIAQRWLTEIAKPTGRTTEQIVRELLDPASGVLAGIDGRDLLRLELNMQAYRKAAASDDTNFGTEAAYIMRVFRWDERLGLFMPSYLRDQIDRDRVLARPALRKALVDFLSRSDSVSAIDKGTLEIPAALGVLAERGVSISPGGNHRSANQPYWNAKESDQQILTDAEIGAALANVPRSTPLSFIKSKDDFRTRVNETSCTNCHQTRAIAGFHFPGADRAKTPAMNAVLLAGSPQFYGDQPRRLEILKRIAEGPVARLTEYQLAIGYAARPMNRFASALVDTQLIGGWGGACLVESALADSQRKWGCNSGLRCRQLFASRNDKVVGTCVPDGRKEIGDALQAGTVSTRRFGDDLYTRSAPNPVVNRDTRIPASAFPSSPPAQNSYYGAHQEFYKGDPASHDPTTRRDASTGGFPAGMLRLSECMGLPSEASCALIASSGFNKCIDRLAVDPVYSIQTCFDNFTTYSGIRACNAAAPCRDDYICVKPIGYSPANAVQLVAARREKIQRFGFFQKINGRSYDPDDFGEKGPDGAWIARDDRRGVCIPPYFVFQFRSDGHPAP